MKKIRTITALAITLVTMSSQALAARLIELPQGQIEPVSLSNAMGDSELDDANNVQKTNEMIKVAEAATTQSLSDQELMERAINAIFPVTTPGMSAKNHQPYHIFKKPVEGLYGSFAIIGNDTYSVSWLEQHQQEFAQNKVTVMLVNVVNDKEYMEILTVGDGIEIIPVSGQQMVDTLGIDYYPVLVTSIGYGQ